MRLVENNSSLWSAHVQSPTTHPTIQAVVFDLDGVLMNSEWLAFKIWRELAARHGGLLAETDYPGMVGISAEETAAYVMAKTAVSFDVTQSCAWVWGQIIERMGTEIEPLPGSTELVSSLASRGYPLAIASNSLSGYIDTALAGLRLEAYFPIRVGIDQVSQGKPAPDVYLTAAERLGVRPENCLAIEDSRVGVQAAAFAGMRVIAVPGPHDHENGFHHAWRVMPTLMDVKKQLEAM
jgi:beta-phosphoglucomutase-like phosphatase (HAD superfamily)